MLIILAQAAAADPPSSWIAIVGYILALFTPVIIAWSAVRVAKLRSELANLRTVRTEVAATVIAAISPNEIFKILYVGNTDQDQIKMVRIFRVAGVKNQIVTLNSADDAFDYLKAHPSVLFVIILVTDIHKGTAFLDMVMSDDETKDKTVFFMDGNDPATALAAYQGGGAGMLKEPLDWTALMGLMNKQGLTMTIEKAK